MFKGHNCLMIVGEIIVFIHKKMVFRSRDIKISKPKSECIMGVMPSVWAHGNIHSLKEKKVSLSTVISTSFSSTFFSGCYIREKR